MKTNKLQNEIDIIMELPKTKSTYYMTATKGSYKRFYNFTNYEMLNKVYEYRKAENWEIEIKMN